MDGENADEVDYIIKTTLIKIIIVSPLLNHPGAYLIPKLLDVGLDGLEWIIIA